jgi:anthranilate phosphoribosyltransferase
LAYIAKDSLALSLQAGERILVNAAFAIQVICPEKDINACLNEARESLQSGQALDVLKKFIDINN